MAALLLLDSLSLVHPDTSLPSPFPRLLDLPFSPSRCLPLSPLSLPPTRPLPDPGFSGPREVKLFVDRFFDAHQTAEPSWQNPLTCRCVVSPLFDGLEPLPRRSGEAGRARNDAMTIRSQVIGDNLTSIAAADSNHRSLLPDNDATAQNSTALQPSSSGDQGGSTNTLVTDRRQELDLRRKYSRNPSYLSVSQSARSRRQTIRNGAVIQMADRSSQTANGIHGATGVYMTFAMLILGITAVLQKGGLLGGNNASTIICSRCDGYGIEPCDICGGRGRILWEGKLKRADPCPLCFGSCTRKCRTCGGIRVKKGLPPIVQQVAQKSARRN